MSESKLATPMDLLRAVSPVGAKTYMEHKAAIVGTAMRLAIVVATLLFLPLVGLTALPRVAGSSTTLTLEQAAAIALERHPLLTAAAHLSQAAENRLDAVRSAYYPQLLFNTSFTRWDWTPPNKRILLGNSLNDLYAEFAVQQLLYNGGRTSLQSDLARNLLDAEHVNSQRLRQNLVFSVARAYLLLLKAERIVDIQDLTLSALREHIATAELLYRSGSVSQLDVLKAQTQLALANEELLKSRNSVIVRRQELFGAMGLDTTYDFATVDVTEALWQRERFRSFGEDSLLSVLTAHPDLQRARLEVRGREKEAALARAAYYPSVQLRGSYNWEDSSLPPDNNHWGVAVGLSLPLSQGGVTRATIAEARSRAGAAQATEDAVRQRLQVALRTTLTTLDDTRGRIRGAEEVVRLAQESAKVASLSYRTGHVSNLDVLDAEMVLNTARINHVQVLTDFALAVAELQFTLGSTEAPFTSHQVEP